jgi:hypothetical protein
MVTYAQERTMNMFNQIKILIKHEKIYFEFYRKFGQYTAMQTIKFNNFDNLKTKFIYNNLSVEESDKILRRKRLYNDTQRMISMKADNNIAVYWNDYI